MFRCSEHNQNEMMIGYGFTDKKQLSEIMR